MKRVEADGIVIIFFKYVGDVTYAVHASHPALADIF
jgi:hypothetical protein